MTFTTRSKQFCLLQIEYHATYPDPSFCLCACVDTITVDTVVPPSQDEATEGTMSSEALPLIFEPFEDVTPEGAAAEAVAEVTLVPGSAQPPAAMVTREMPQSEVDLDQLVTVETDSDGPSHAPPLLMPDWTLPWQTSGGELLEPISSLGPSVSQQQAATEPEDHSERGEVAAGPESVNDSQCQHNALWTNDFMYHNAVLA